MTRDELTLKAISAYNSNLHSGMTTALGAVVDMVLEEAARVCDRRYVGDNNREDMEARRCATAIRALKDQA